MASAPQTRVDLQGVPETALWTLYDRALEARRPDAILHDPTAIALLQAIDYPFEQRYGRASPARAQWQALRAACFDREVRRFLAEHPDGTVVALGEGLETQFWRVDNGLVRWLSVDLPETIGVRRRLLPASPRLRSLACSALDERWPREVDPASGVLVTAQGLLMYLQPEDVYRLVVRCAERLPGGSLLFDTVPRWFSERALQGKMRTPSGREVPPLPWGLDSAELARIRSLHPNVVDVQELRLPRGRGALFGYLLPLAGALPAARALMLRVFVARFGPTVEGRARS